MLKILSDEEKCCYLQETLLSLVSPELNSLINCWLAALRDSALLSLPPEFKPQLPPKGGTYYTAECADVSSIADNKFKIKTLVYFLITDSAHHCVLKACLSFIILII